MRKKLRLAHLLLWEGFEGLLFERNSHQWAHSGGKYVITHG